MLVLRLRGLTVKTVPLLADPPLGPLSLGLVARALREHATYRFAAEARDIADLETLEKAHPLCPPLL